ncbi:helix-turn-helix transcriptional regulator [Actinomadura geliboluensis]|uniref:helix-turn-helix transcriptional regulator n=1 Tax=Actinomadura geliboluensis TaxID=882440 RepID=UPI0036969004
MSPNLGTLVRSARVAHGWTQRDLANRLHCSRSTISHLETGAQPLDDVTTLQRLAEVLEITPTALGITATVTIHPPAEDDMRRRQLLTGLAVTAAAASAPARAAVAAAAGPEADPRECLLARIRDAMLGIGHPSQPIQAPQLRPALNAAIRDYDNCQYSRLVDALPRLISSGHSAGEAASSVPSETYTLVTRIMIKLDDQLGWNAANPARTPRLALPLILQTRHLDNNPPRPRLYESQVPHRAISKLSARMNYLILKPRLELFA